MRKYYYLVFKNPVTQIQNTWETDSFGEASKFNELTSYFDANK
jgi:hypothetical protein